MVYIIINTKICNRSSLKFLSVLNMASPYKPYRKPLEEVVKSEINDLYSDLKDRTKEIVNSSTNTIIDRLDRHQRQSKDDITLANDELKSTNNELKSLNDDLTFLKGEVAFVKNTLTTVNSELADQSKELDNLNIPVLLEKCVSQTLNETINKQIQVLLETVNETINEQLPVLLERCVQPMIDQVLRSRPKSVRLLFEDDMSHQSLMTNSYHPGPILNDVSSPMYQNVSVPSIGNKSAYSTVREKRKVSMISENDEETCDSTKKPKTDDDDVIAFLSNIRPRPGEDYWENSEIVNSIWCRYCLCYNKSNTHDEDNCEYNIENRQTKNGKKHKLCEICGQTQFKHHDPGREKCNKTRRIMMKLYDIWPISIERIGFDSRSGTFTSTYKNR